MPLRLVEINDSHVHVLAQLQQFYQYDLSEFEHDEPNDSGLFHVSTAIPSAADVHLIVLKGKPAGVVCYSELSNKKSVPQYRLEHLFIMRCYRKLGIGEEIVRIIFDQLPGNWDVEVSVHNDGAIAFMRQVLRRYTFRSFRELNSQDGQTRIFEFQSTSCDPHWTPEPGSF